MKTVNRFSVFVTLAIILCSNTAISAEFIPLGDLPGGNYFSAANDVSADGTTVVGRSSSLSGSEAFRWTNTNGMIGLGDFSGGIFYSEALGVSYDGNVIVGNSRTSQGDAAFRWTSTGGMAGFGTGIPSSAYAVSADGSVIVGRHPDHQWGTVAYRWSSTDGILDLADYETGLFAGTAVGVSADGTVVVGAMGTGQGAEAYRWTESSGLVNLGDLLGGTIANYPEDVSSDGQVIVGQGTSALGREAFRWSSSEGMVGLGDLEGGEYWSIARGVSGDGSIVVGQSEVYRGDEGLNEAFVWTSTGGMQKLSTLATAAGIDLTGWTLKNASAISDDGNVIVGNATNPDGNTEAFIIKNLFPLDSDNDGLQDHIEDANENGIVDPGETDPHNPDTDGDGALDGQEDTNANGIVDAGEADPLNPDTDGDGLTDGYEINVVMTDPSSVTSVYTLQCDMNEDEDIDLGDLLLLQRKLLGYPPP